MNDSTRTSSRYLVVALAVIGTALAVLAWLYLSPSTSDNQAWQSKEAAERFEKSTRAASYLENIQYEPAEAMYGELLKLYPDEPAYLRNAAIAALANVKYQMDLAQDPKNDVDRIRGELPQLFDRASKAIQQFRERSPDDPIAYQLDVLRDARWIAVLSAANPIIADEEQARLFEKLKSYVQRFPNNAFLVTQFNNSAEMMSAVDPDALAETLEPLRRVQQANPRNIYLLCLLTQRLVQAKDPSVLALVEPLAELLQPFEWKWKMERRPKDLSDLRRAAELGKTDLDTALGIIIGWVGEAKFTEGSKVDAKSIDVSELAFLDLSDVERLLRERRVVATEAAAPKFQITTLEPMECKGVRWFDWDIDTRAELLTWTDRHLMLGSVSVDRGWQELAKLSLPFPIEGVVAADLFAVDSHRGTSARREIDPNDREAQLSASMRHETIRDLVLFGESGVAIVEFLEPFDSVPHWSIMNEEVGLQGLQGVGAVLPIDWESDGDLDLAILAKGSIQLRENMGNRRFRDVNESSLLPPESFLATAMVVVDFDRDVDLDILVSHTTGFAVLENIQHGQFRYRELGESWKTLSASHSLAIGDFDNNYSWDFVGGDFRNSRNAGAELVLTATQPGQGVTASQTQSLGTINGIVATADWNNDAKLDVVSCTRQGVTFWRNQGNHQFQAVSLLARDQGDSSDTNAATHSLAIGDPHADGWLDIATIVDGHPTVISPAPIPDHHFLVYRVKGISDENGGGRNNQFAVGSTVEIFGPFGYQVRIIEDDSVHFGLGPDAAYSLRVIFVNGLTQGIINPKNNSILEEKQVLIGSCPFLYGWDGERWHLVTDLLWNAPLGLQVAKGKVLPDRRWEYLLIPGRSMQPYRDAYELRITEELWETAYFDHVALMRVDHPANVEILSNEKVGPPDIAEPKLWAFEQTVAPKSVLDQYGREWLESLLETDGEYAIPFRRQFKQGLVEPSTLEIDFGSLDTSRPVQLILTGWIYPTDTSLNIGIDQNPELEPPLPPQLQTVQANGEFATTIPFTGFPGGKPKTIVVPLDGLFPTEDHRIRIQHSSQIFWDQIRVGYGTPIGIDTTKTDALIAPPDGTVRATWLPLESSELHYRGFSREMPRRWFEPHGYDYQRLSLEPAWPPLGGNFTRYGDVLKMVGADDDHLVVMGAGDEMTLRYRRPDAELPEGWVSDFILHSVGWDKDAALNTLEGQSSLPLPFSRMSQYPPTADDRMEAHRIEMLHRDSLIRQQPLQPFWKPTTTQGKGPGADGR